MNKIKSSSFNKSQSLLAGERNIVQMQCIMIAFIKHIYIHRMGIIKE